MTEEGAAYDNIDKFYKLKQLVDSSISATRDQINNISNDKVGSTFRWIMTLGLSLGIPVVYSHYSLLIIVHIILTWIPISFVLFLIISLFSIIDLINKYSTYRRMTEKDWVVMKQATEGNVKHVMQRDLGKSTAPLLYSIMLIFILSLALLLAIIIGTIPSTNHGNLILPSLISIIMVFGGIGGIRIGTDSNKRKFTNNKVPKGVLALFSREKSITKGIFAFSAIAYSIFLILPFSLAIWLTAGMVENLLVFFIILASQILFFLTIGSILSRGFALKYLEDAARVYQKISEEISLVLLSKVDNVVEYDKLETEYLQAKKYSIRRDTSLFLFVFYMYDSDIKYLKTNPEFKK